MAATQPEEVELPQVVNLSQVDAGNVRAEFVRASQTSIEKLEAEEADLNVGIIGVATTGKLNSRRAIIGAVFAKQAELHEAAVAGVRGESISLNGNAGLMVARSLEAPEVNGIVVAGTEIHATNIRTGILIGRQVNGNVETVLDTRTALMAGIIGGTVAGLILLAGRLLFGKKK
jgi:hypothetical protein